MLLLRCLFLPVLLLTLMPPALSRSLPRSLHAQYLPSLPAPVSNNAVAGLIIDNRPYIVSFNGLGKGRTYRDVQAETYVLDVTTGTWTRAGPVPGGIGRLASAAAAVGDLAYVFGGYSVAGDGSELSTPWTYSFDPVKREFRALQPIPVPVDDSVAVAYADRFIFLISGWHDSGNVKLVQRYDTQTDSWEQATPIPGPAVFGHAGGLVDNRIVYCDGVMTRPVTDGSSRFAASKQCFLGIIDGTDSRRIDWRGIDAHPGPPRYRMASAGITGHNSVLFIGGSENPYNYNGTGYNGKPSEPSADGFLFDLDSLEWQRLPQANSPTMDHRALVVLGNHWLTIGGMMSNQTVTDKVIAYNMVRTDNSPPKRQ